MSEHKVERVPTALGAEILVEDAPEWMKEGGVMVHLRMQRPTGCVPRHAEVYLSPSDLDAVIIALEAFQGF